MSVSASLRSDVRGIQILGPCCTGKSTIARMLASEVRMVFLEGDNFHTPANLEAIKRGVPLTDKMRTEQWIPAMANAMADYASSGRPAVLTWSGLRRTYRARIVIRGVRRFWLHLTHADAIARAQCRTSHFAASTAVVRSNYEILEPPGQEESDIIVLPARFPPEILIEMIKDNVRELRADRPDNPLAAA